MSDRELETYLKTLCQRLGLPPEQRQALNHELPDHLEERLAELIEQGISRDDAIQQTLEEDFGDPKIVASKFGFHPKRFQASLSLIVGLSASLLCLVMLIMIGILCNFTGGDDWTVWTNIEGGNLAPMVLDPSFWSSILEIRVTPAVYFDSTAFGFTVGVLAIALGVAWAYRRTSRPELALACLLCAPFPWAAGAISLATYSPRPEEVGTRLALMVFGVLYCSLASLFFLLIPRITQARQWSRSRKTKQPRQPQPRINTHKPSPMLAGSC